MPTLKLRAKSRDGYIEDIAFDLSIIARDTGIESNTPFRHRVEIEGINISSRLIDPGVSLQNSLDTIRLNRYAVSNTSIPLRNDDGYFRTDIEDNFWDTHNLNPGGFLNNVKVYVEFLESGAWNPVLFFQGQIARIEKPLSGIATLVCFSNTTRLTQIQLEGAGVGVEKIVELSPQGEDAQEPVVEGSYTPEQGLAPLKVSENPEAYHHQDCLTLKDVINDALGTKDNTGVLNPTDFKTQGGYLGDPLLLKTKTAYRYKTIRSAFERLSKLPSHLTTVFTDFEDLPSVEPHISARENIQFNTEPGRITRLPTDWVYDPATRNLYVLLTNPSEYIGDQLVAHNLETDSYHILQEFDASLACYRLATSNYDTFYILCRDATDLDLSDPTAEETEDWTLGFDSSQPLSKMKVLQYLRTEDWLETLIDEEDIHGPQLGLHYHVGFANRNYAWEGINPARQSAFLVNNDFLYYRYATETEFGVARSNRFGITESVISADRDDYENHLNFAFCFDSDDNLYFAYSQGQVSASTLIIERYDGTTAKTLTSIRRATTEMTDLDNGGGAFLGVHEILFLDDYLYFVVPVARGNRDIDTSAGSVLYRYGIYSLQLETIDTADFVHFGFAGLTVHSETGDTLHDNAVYYVQSPIECYKYPAYNPDLDSYDTETAENYLPDFKGHLKRVLPDGEVQDCGAIRFDAEGAFRGLLCKCLTFDDGLHLMISQGNPDALMQKNADVSLPSAVLWATFDRRLKFVLPEVPASGSLNDAYSQLALQANATFSLDRNVLSVVNRAPIGALLETFITDSAILIPLKDQNRTTFPSSGYVLIDSEIIRFGARYVDQLAELENGRIGTTPAVHQEGTQITFLDAAVGSSEVNSEDIFWSIDTVQLYNSVRDENRLIQIKDELSVFEEKVLNLNLDLDALRIPWLEFIAGDYLHRFKDVRFLLNFSLRPAFGLRVNNIIGFHYSPLPPIALRIMDITYQKNRTAIKGRQVEPDIRVSPQPLVAEPNTTFRILDPSGNSIAVDGAGNHLLFIGDTAIQTVEPLVFESLLDDVTLTQFEKTQPVLMPEAFGGTPPYTYAMTGLPDGIFFNPKTRYRYGSPENAGTYEAEYSVTDADGITHREAFEITVSVADLGTQRILDPAGNPMAVDGAGNHLIFYGTYSI